MKLRERICGAAVGEFRAGEAVALWSVSGAERAAEGAAYRELSSQGEDGTFSRARVFLRDSTIDALAGSRPRASRFRGSGALAVSCGISRAIRADRDANFEPAARKMTGVRWSHLMH